MAFKTPGKEHLMCLRPLTTDPPSELDVLRHDSHPLSVDSAEVGILKETNKVSFRSLLKGKDSAALEAQVGLEVLGDLTNESLEGKLSDEQFSALLIATDRPESDGTGSEPVGLLDTSSRGG